MSGENLIGRTDEVHPPASNIQPMPDPYKAPADSVLERLRQRLDVALATRTELADLGVKPANMTNYLTLAVDLDELHGLLDRLVRAEAALLSVERVFAKVDLWDHVTDDANDLIEELLAWQVEQNGLLAAVRLRGEPT